MRPALSSGLLIASISTAAVGRDFWEPAHVYGLHKPGSQVRALSGLGSWGLMLNRYSVRSSKARQQVKYSHDRRQKLAELQRDYHSPEP
jgi:hypothetical protein